VKFCNLPVGFADALETNPLKQHKRDTEYNATKKPIQCTQCGAPLDGHKCEYCGSVYEQIPPKIADDHLSGKAFEYWLWTKTGC
jgi:predicted amidophosphoribosyltransferase